ncbi:hypothetical protein A3770_12p65810 [Chloropicon primus]|uniref:Tetratricopeptide repeat domain-containing protein n=1 Tax=Chloropicon primus TaxID=1764295 RepID=A0A5B8MU68_9CHLO|nr:hypothetical protein A3770_12p65810 [Chloropicon primus]|eukprot:QDZ24063.1 hypothetical protein A3770_12p65810 [Chloropicon primus]
MARTVEPGRLNGRRQALARMGATAKGTVGLPVGLPFALHLERRGQRPAGGGSAGRLGDAKARGGGTRRRGDVVRMRSGSWDEEEYEAAGDGERKGFRLDSWALGGTVASTCAVAFIGVAEAPVYLLALPVLLPMVALISYRERTRRKHKEELSLALRSQQQVNTQVNYILGQSSASSSNLVESVANLSAMLERVEDRLAASSEQAQETQEAVKKSFSQLMKMNQSATNHVLKEQAKNMREIVAEEVSYGVNQVKEGEEAASNFLEVNLLDVKRELSELESIQTDLLRLVENVYDEARASSTSARGGSGDEEWLKDELSAMKDNIVIDVEDILARQNEEKEVGELGAAADNSAGILQLEEKLAEIRQVAEQNQKSIQDVQDALYSSAGQVRAEAESEIILDEVRGVSTTVETLADSLEAVQTLPSVVDSIKEDVRDAIRELADLNLAGSGAVTQNQVNASYTSTSVYTSAAFEGLERKIDEVARATEVIESLASQFKDLAPSGSAESRGALPEAGGTPTVQEALEEGASSDGNPSWLEYDPSEVEGAEKVLSTNAQARASTSGEGGPEEPAKEPEASRGRGGEDDEPVAADLDIRIEEEEAGEEAVEEAEEEAGEEAADSPSVEKLLGEGLALLRRGREEASEGEAEGLFSQALEYFDRAAELNPESVTAYGNKGNTLLCSARQKMRVLSTFAKEARDSPFMSEESIKMSQDLKRRTGEILVQSGRCYRTVLSLDPRDARALVNWGSALCLRAKLIEVEDADSAVDLYDAAIEKFAASLQLDPNMAEGERLLNRAQQSLDDLLGY